MAIACLRVQWMLSAPETLVPHCAIDAAWSCSKRQGPTAGVLIGAVGEMPQGDAIKMG